MEECFNEVDVMDYIMNVVPIDDGHRATVKKRTVNAMEFTVVIPSEGHPRTRFGSSTCGTRDSSMGECGWMTTSGLKQRDLSSSNQGCIVFDYRLMNYNW